MALVLLWLLALNLAPLGAQGPDRQLDFLDDRLVPPEAAQYDSAQYRASGAQAAFEQIRRGPYQRGQYGEAALQLAQLSGDFPFKAAVWVYLARAFFRSGDHPSARQALARAAQLMPELAQTLWQPLDRGLDTQVRALASQIQAQVDYYPQRQAQMVPLIRLYRFLADTTAARQVVLGAARRRADLFGQAELASGAQRQSYLDAATQWDGLIAALNSEWGLALATPDPAAVRADSLKAAEVLRLLQLRVDYYLALPGEYRQLFGEYLRLGRRAEAQAVLAAVEQEVRRLGLLASVAATPEAAAKAGDQAAALSDLGQQLRAQLGSPSP